jgi:hypothetical protein
LSAKPESLILLMSHDHFHLSVVEQIAVNEQLTHQVIILDTTSLSAGKIYSYSPRLLRFFGYSYPARDIPSEFARIGCIFLKVEDFSNTNIEPDPCESESIKDAIHGALVTYFRHHKPLQEVKRSRRAHSKLQLEVRMLAERLITVLDGRPLVERAFVPNGRFPAQKISENIFRNRHIETWHYERGEPPRGVYLQTYPPQDRIRSQEMAIEMSKKGTNDEIRACAEDWLIGRADPNSGFNEFSYLWKGKPSDEKSLQTAGLKIAGFFSSSQDEFLHLGKDWQRHSWPSQVVAFDVTMSRLEKLGYEIFLRVHPNLATKAHSYFKFERSEFEWLQKRHPNLRIYWHDVPINTYDLLRTIDLCFVWDSTVGLEASTLGIPTWSFATTRYGLVADVREALDEKQLPISDFEWVVDKRGAFSFINYLIHRDIELTVDSSKWVDWNITREPWQVQISKILESGGNLSSIDSLISILDTYRNRGLRANVTYLRKRFRSFARL